MTKLFISLETVSRLTEKAKRGRLSPSDWAGINLIRSSFGAKNFRKACKMLKEAGI